MLTTRVPVRTGDLGGWTDTWFASAGLICNVAVEPGIEVRVRSGDHTDRVALRLGEQPSIVGRPAVPTDWGDPLIGACLIDAPLGLAVDIRSGVPAGCGLGTSAAVAVALLAALDAWAGRTIDAHEIARRAHRVETGLGRQSGVQDHAAAALGGVRLWDVQYPDFRSIGEVTDPDVLDALDARLLTVYLGSPHESSALHELVIGHLETLGGTRNDELLGPLREAARRGFDALAANDLRTYGMALVANHEGQRRLHPELISDLADHVVTLAALHGACGWKVNGAGGEGGSLALLAPDAAGADALRVAVSKVAGVALLDLHVAREGIVVERC